VQDRELSSHEMYHRIVGRMSEVKDIVKESIRSVIPCFDLADQLNKLCCRELKGELSTLIARSP